MKKLVLPLFAFLILGVVGTAAAQFVLDGDSTDWQSEPILASAPNNLQDYFPDEVGALFSDRVDVKNVRAKIVGNRFYFFIRFWGGPAWPNHAYQDTVNGQVVYRNRGYYHLMLDLDNDPSTGWNNHWYETHYTPLGYYASQGIEGMDPVGAECYLQLGIKQEWDPPKGDGHVQEISYYSEDTHEIDYHAGTGNGYDIFGLNVPEDYDIDSTACYRWEGYLHETEIGEDTVHTYWAGHAWGYDFLEYGVELTLLRQYWMKQGMDYFKPGDTIGIAAFIETPIDDWGVDVSPRGELTVPDMPPVTGVGGSILVDGDSTDWASMPILASAPNNLQDYFPDEVGALFSDRVDVKHVRAKIIGNAFYFFIRFWGGPAWPNHAYQDTVNGQVVYRNRGYYHLMLDLDNDPSTGWNNHWYETHYTPLGYYASQGIEGMDPVGAECYLQLGIKQEWDPPKGDGHVQEISYYSEDTHEIDYHAGTGNGYDIFGLNVPEDYNIDSSACYKWSGDLFETEIGGDTLHQYWAAHAWGYDFLEYGVELTPLLNYWKSQGMDYFKPGDVIGIAAFIETPIDDWGVDVSPRGQIVVPAIPVRPSSITFDGDSTDWADKPILASAPNNLQDYFPDEVGALFSDRVDVKHVKAFVNLQEDAFYFFIRFWGGPAWPNHAYEDTVNGQPVYRNRGYYHLMLDLDNDPSTGWNNHWYETHYTPLGYYASQGIEGMDPVGAECYLQLGLKQEWDPPKGDGHVQEISYYAEDTHEIDYHAGTGNGYDMYGFYPEPYDSVSVWHFDGMMLETEVGMDSVLHWAGHAWGYDFLEYGVRLDDFRKYWRSQGKDYLKPGDTIGIAAFIETPIDDWGVDVSPRGELTVGAPSGVESSSHAQTPRQYALDNNYPNPFNPQTTIGYYLPRTSKVSIVVYNTMGQKVRTLVNRSMPQGHHTVTWDGTDDSGNLVSSGIYFYSLRAGDVRITKRMTLLK